VSDRLRRLLLRYFRGRSGQWVQRGFVRTLVWIAPVAGASQVRITMPVASGADDQDLSTADSVPQPTFT